MNVQYKGRQTVNSFGDKLVRPLEPAAIISFTEEEEGKVVAILEETGYDFDIFGEPGFLWAEVAVDGKEDYGNAGYQPVRPHDAQLGKAERVDEAARARWRVCCHGRHPSAGDAEDETGGRRGS